MCDHDGLGLEGIPLAESLAEDEKELDRLRKVVESELKKTKRLNLEHIQQGLTTKPISF